MSSHFDIQYTFGITSNSANVSKVRFQAACFSSFPQAGPKIAPLDHRLTCSSVFTLEEFASCSERSALQLRQTSTLLFVAAWEQVSRLFSKPIYGHCWQHFLKSWSRWNGSYLLKLERSSAQDPQSNPYLSGTFVTLVGISNVCLTFQNCQPERTISSLPVTR